jgi:hypothetical protein
MYFPGNDTRQVRIKPATPISQVDTIQKSQSLAYIGGYLIPVLSNGTRGLPINCVTSTAAQAAAIINNMTYLRTRKITVTLSATEYVNPANPIFGTTDAQIQITYRSPMTAGLDQISLNFLPDAVVMTGSIQDAPIVYTSVRAVAGLYAGVYLITIQGNKYSMASRIKDRITCETMGKPGRVNEDMADLLAEKHYIGMTKFPPRGGGGGRRQGRY